MDFDRSDPIPTNIRLAAANQGAIYVKDPYHLVGAGRETSLDEFPGRQES